MFLLFVSFYVLKLTHKLTEQLSFITLEGEIYKFRQLRDKFVESHVEFLLIASGKSKYLYIKKGMSLYIYIYILCISQGAVIRSTSYLAGGLLENQGSAM